jgi:hypothetical protein
MGNTHSDFLTPGSLKQAERNLLGFTGLPSNQIEARKVQFTPESYMMTYIVGDKSLPPMVFVHGYGGSGLLMYKIFKPLS